MSVVLQSFSSVFNPITLFLVILGTAWGLVAGALPGLSASMAVILILPFTYGMEAIQSIVVLVAVYVGAMCGGSISAILLKTPGTPAAVATVFDGYPMAMQGRAPRALGIAITASSAGGIFSGLVMVFCAPLLANWAIKFQSAEFFTLALLGLSCIASIGTERPVKALISACLGLLVSTVGLDGISGTERYTFGRQFLMSGIDYIPVMIGAYAVAEVYRNIMSGQTASPLPETRGKTVNAQIIGIGHIIKNWAVYLKASIIGTIVGIIPAAGGSIAALISYSEAVRSSKHPEQFGKGAEEGIIASEAANNAAVGGSLVPTLVLGIPGGNVTAIMLAAFTMHGLIPGPMLLRNQPGMLYSILLGIVISSLLLFVLGFIVSKQFSRIIALPYPFMATIILTLGILGSYSLKNSMYDVYIMFGFSFLGYFFEKYKYSTSSFILGIILGKIAEDGLRKQLLVSGGDWSSFFTRPISLAVILLSVISFLTPALKARKKRKLAAGSGKAG
jgi:putative tricarboxylic transport membrane protein